MRLQFLRSEARRLFASPTLSVASDFRPWPSGRGPFPSKRQPFRRSAHAQLPPLQLRSDASLQASPFALDAPPAASPSLLGLYLVRDQVRRQQSQDERCDERSWSQSDHAVMCWLRSSSASRRHSTPAAFREAEAGATSGVWAHGPKSPMQRCAGGMEDGDGVQREHPIADAKVRRPPGKGSV